VIAAVEGFAVAGGMELALWADMRVVAENATFGIFCRRFGVPLIDLGTIRLPRLIGHSQAMDLILTGRPVDAHEAYRMGIANRLVGRGEACAQAIALAQEIARFPQTCMRADRLSALRQWDLSEEDAISNEMRGGLEVIASGETFAGAARFASGIGKHGAFGAEVSGAIGARGERLMTMQATKPAVMQARTFTARDFRLQSGVVMGEVTIAYGTLGKLSPARDNVVLVTHGNTSGPQMIDPNGSAAEGAWSEIVGPGKAVDTDKYFAICPNMLGSSYGSTNAESIDPKHGHALRAALPRHHRARHRGHATRAARRSRHLEPGCGRRPVLWRLPGVSMGGGLSRRRQGYCGRRHRADRAARARRGQCHPPPRDAVAGPELERRRLLRPWRRARKHDANPHRDAEDLRHRDTAARHAVGSGGDRGGDPQGGRRLGQRF
jgi:hypothetical protein